MTTNHHNFAKLQNQVQEERKLVSSDNYDITVQQLIDMFEAGSIIIPLNISDSLYGMPRESLSL